MPSHIAALPQDAVLRLGSSQAIYDSVSVTKELIDNALDAGADSIKIILSENTLDSIQVTDNGRGIPVEDQAAVGRHHHTSKIKTFADLENLGGSSLGFRGEALASIAELSGRDLTITTRTADVDVAAKLHVNRHGVVVSEHKVSHPVGTTILVSDFLAPMPVRQKRAQQQVQQTRSRIKDLITTYCVARLHVRFQVVWSRTAERKNDMVYAPRNKECSLKDTVLSLFGMSCIENCFVAHWPSNEEVYEDLLIRIEAVLEKPATSGRPHAMPCQFIAVDGRPISCSRGTGKKIYQVYRNFIGDTNNPFLCMHLHCVSRAYDVNIEPAKDDVCFEDNVHALETVEQFFTTAFSDHRRPTTSESGQSQTVHGDKGVRDHQDADEMLEPDASHQLPGSSAELREPVGVQSSILPAASNPWTIAKMTGSSGITDFSINERHSQLHYSRDTCIPWPLPTPDPSPEQHIPIRLMTEHPSNTISSLPSTNTPSQRISQRLPQQTTYQLQESREEWQPGTLDEWLVSRSASQRCRLNRLGEGNDFDTMQIDTASPESVQLLRSEIMPVANPRPVRSRPLRGCELSSYDPAHDSAMLRVSQRSRRALPQVAPGERRRSLRAHDRKLENRLKKPFRIPRARSPASVMNSQGPLQNMHHDRPEAAQQSLPMNQHHISNSIPHLEMCDIQGSSLPAVHTKPGGTSTNADLDEDEESIDFRGAFAAEADGGIDSIPECIGLILDCSISQAEVEACAYAIGHLQSSDENDAAQSRAFKGIEESTISEWEDCLTMRLHTLDSSKNWSNAIGIREALDGWRQENSLN